MPNTKIATCCYCGSHAALSLEGRQRHELACATCGAPISRLKQLPVAAPRPSGPKPAERHRAHAPDPRARKMKPAKKRKSLARRALGELWDVVEDILD